MLEKVRKILFDLRKAGYQSYLVGGCVRDIIMGREPVDYDVVTDALPAQVTDVFRGRRVNTVGKSFGVTIVDGVDVAMFRGERYPVPGKPMVTRKTSFREDVSRRDFTINGLGMTPEGEVIDYVGGLEDIDKGIVRAIGEPMNRFLEDPLRMIRTVTFSSRFGFEIEYDTVHAIEEMKYLLTEVPRERIAKELEKMVEKNVLSRGATLLKELGLLPLILSQIAHLPGLPQNPQYHELDAFDHTILTVENAEKAGAEKAVIYAALFHDCAKGLPSIRHVNPKNSQPRDNGHEKTGAVIAFEAIMRLGLGRRIAENVRHLVRFHMSFSGVNTYAAAARRLRTFAKACRDRSELESFVKNLFVLAEADELAGKNNKKDLSGIKAKIFPVLDILPFYPKDAGIRGEGMGTGPEVGTRIARLLLDAQNRALQGLIRQN